MKRIKSYDIKPISEEQYQDIYKVEDEYLNTIYITDLRRLEIETYHHHREIPFGLYMENIGGTYEIDDEQEQETIYTDENKERLKKAIKQLTPRQQKVLELTMAGLSQKEIAIELGICQTSVHKCLCGNIDYKYDGKRYGGALKKLQKLLRDKS